MSTTTDTKACLSVDMIEGLFTSFAQRRFEKGSGVCVVVPSFDSRRFDHSSSEWCAGTGFPGKPTECEGSNGSRQASSPPGDRLLPGHSIDEPVAGHEICMMYNDDPDGVVSRFSESEQIRPLSAIVH
jgi:hypothetical protein